MVGREPFIRNIGAGIDVGEHTERRRIDDDGVAVHHLTRQVGVGDAPLFSRAGNESALDAQLFQSVEDRLRRAAGAENQCPPVGVRKQRLDGTPEADDVGVVADELRLAEEATGELDDIDGTDEAGVLVEVVEVRYYLLLVGDGNVQAVKFGASICSDSNFWLKKFFEKECPKGYPIKPYFCITRIFVDNKKSSYLLPVYNEQIPKVKVCAFASLKPTRESRPSMTFPCGTTLIDAGK